jgi:hypothetical protein
MNIKSKNMQISIQGKKKGRNGGMMKSCRNGLYINCDCTEIPTGYMFSPDICNDGISIPTAEVNTNRVLCKILNVYMFINNQ